MNIQGVSTRKVKAISEELCGHSFSASAISEINKRLDAELGRFARRELKSEYPYPIIDARYEKLREQGVIRSRAVLVAIGIDWEGRRQVLGLDMANRESSTSWKEFLLGLKRRVRYLPISLLQTSSAPQAPQSIRPPSHPDAFYPFEISVHKETLVASRPRRRSKRASAGGRHSATRPYRHFISPFRQTTPHSPRF